MVNRMALPLPFEDQPERSIYTVSRLNREVRQLLERGIPAIWIEGEISGFSQPASGHWYFTLKDRSAQVACVMWRANRPGSSFTPSAGQHVIARARVSLFEGRGQYQLSVERLEEAGLGALKRDFDRVKEKLAAEGLFALGRKRSLPRMPRRVGVVTSPSGAAVRDVLHVLTRRFPPIEILVYPTPVQGAGAAPRIVEALALASARRECDVLILTRGGGSIEDLWAFNDERVARAIIACSIPVVSGIGHEIDFTIADFAADVRAPTPSAAAELVVPDRAACLAALARTADRLNVAMRRELRDAHARCVGALHRLKLADPGARLAQRQQRLDDLTQRLSGAVRSAVHGEERRLSEAVARLARLSPEGRVRDSCARQDLLVGRLQHAIRQRLAAATHRLELAQRALATVSPLATLARGFAVITRAADGTLLTRAAEARAGEAIEALMADGRLHARVLQVKT
jgi:exodeoxyribonuclease VII large subunit